ncbi:TetR/AcrR family transcriptional regulator [Caballeronia sp. dw_19]|uniref:TetR/AcrR family transcriptional regulator n=1 Tax=Caballeronia sp. dw_19 TaxID=2719791 RepID=UPI001BD2C2EA|nr:TetR/AcrR family transcriptional regulator [Caballeronia sp. dw_19]
MAGSKQHLSNQPLLRIQILDAARVIVVREGFDALSMRKIAGVVGYSPASLYLHFAGRDAIAHALCVEGHVQLLESMHAHDDVAEPVERLKAMAHAYVTFGLTHPEVYRLIFMQNPAYTAAAFNDVASAGETVLSMLTRTLALVHDPAVRAETLWAALHGIVSLSLTAQTVFTAPPDTLIDEMLDLYLPTVIKKKPARRRPSASAG